MVFFALYGFQKFDVLVKQVRVRVVVFEKFFGQFRRKQGGVEGSSAANRAALRALRFWLNNRNRGCWSNSVSVANCPPDSLMINITSPNET
jgi:hypothetical protein